MEKWIDGTNVSKRLKLKDFEIFDLLASGALQPYSPITGKKIKWQDFNRLDHSAAFDKKEYFEKYLFLGVDIDELRLALGKKKETYPPIPPEPKQDTKPVPAPTEERPPIEDFRISYESDISIFIHPPKKPRKAYEFKDLGFRSETGKGWRIIIASLGEGGLFYVGPFVRGGNNTEYDRKQKQLKLCEGKLKTFFEREYGLKIPNDFKFYRLSPDERPGTYKLIIPVVKNDLEAFEAKCKALPDKQIKIEMKSLTEGAVKDGLGQAEKNEIITKLNILAAEAKNRNIVNFVTGRNDQKDNPDLDIDRDAPEDGEEESSLE